MIIKYRIISGEDDEFVRDIELKSKDNFESLHEAIQTACDYDGAMMCTFYLSNKNWDKLQEIAEAKFDEEAQVDVMLMCETKLDNLSPEKGQRFIYIYDFFSVRSFFIEIVNIRETTTDDENLEFPICTLSHGLAPKQIFIDDDIPDDFDSEDPEDFFDNPEEFGFDNIDDYDI
jgi:hypothetical protein